MAAGVSDLGDAGRTMAGMTGSSLQFGLLGAFRVERDGREADLGPRLQRNLLAILVVDAGHVVPVDRLIDLLWRDEPPAAAIASVQAYVSQLRRVLEPDRPARAPARVLVTQDPGYVLRIAGDQVDALRFQQLVRRAHNDLADGQPAAASTRLEDAFALWHGDPLAEFADEPWAVPAVTRLTEAHDLATEDRIGAWLALGRHAEAVAELEAMVAARPLRERRWGQLIVATYRCGRQADALRAYQRCRTVLAGELGLEPGPGLRRLEAAVLAQDASLDWHPAAAAEVRAAGRRARSSRAGGAAAAFPPPPGPRGAQPAPPWSAVTQNWPIFVTGSPGRIRRRRGGGPGRRARRGQDHPRRGGSAPGCRRGVHGRLGPVPGRRVDARVLAVEPGAARAAGRAPGPGGPPATRRRRRRRRRRQRPPVPGL